METLEKDGYELNPYDKCIANKEVNGKQWFIAYHVDDCLVSYVEQDVLEGWAKMMIKHFWGNRDYNWR